MNGVVEFSWTARARPIVEIGIGASAVETGADARWDIATWSSPTAVWSGDEPMWVDITGDTHRIEPVLGRRRATDRFEPGRLAVTVSNESGWADPIPLNDPDTLTLRAGRPIRMGIVHEVFGTVWKFRGYIDSVTPRYDPENAHVVDITAVCALGEVGRATVPKVAVAVGGGELAHARVARIANAVKWSNGLRDFDLTSVTMLATELGGQAADLLAVAVDSLSGALFGDVEGRLALRNRDWQLYDPDSEPLDGRIGQGTTLTTLGHIDFPGTANNYVRVPITAPPADFSSDWRADSIRPAAGNFSIVIESNVRTYFHAGGLIVQFYATDATFPAVSVTDAALDAAGFPAVGQRVHIRGKWDAATDTLYLYWRLPDRDLTDDTGWTLASSTVWAGKAVRTTDAFLYVGVNSNGNPYLGYRAMRQINGVIDVDIHPHYDVTGDTATFTATTGQTVTVFRSGSPDTELVPTVYTPDVAPSAWAFSNARRDIVTRAVLARETDATPIPYDDLIGQSLYGVEDWTATDLVCTTTEQLDRIADRVLRTRGWETAERVESVHIDASTSDAALDLVTLLDVFAPSRYACNLVTEHGAVFDREMFATGVHHVITPDVWTVDVNLDFADPWAVAGGRWGFAYWDESTWTEAA